ncbi:MAG: hypothetical protein FJ398_25025 [Verrucomicrobia bacterium]|nr:hypothetical protein [Verrucomicrobiota bacterium]
MNLFDLGSVFEKIKTQMKSMTIRSIALGLGLITLSLGTARAADPDISKLPPAAKKEGVTYEKDIKPIFEKSCINCHGPEKPKSKYRLDSREAAIKGGSSGEAAVVVGKSEKSPMVIQAADLVEEDLRMPPVDKRDKYPALTKEQIGLLRAWIDQGAK